jgi:hypothetical protein
LQYNYSNGDLLLFKNLAETMEIEKPSNRSCVMEMTAYYSQVDNENITKQGELA